MLKEPDQDPDETMEKIKLLFEEGKKEISKEEEAFLDGRSFMSDAIDNIRIEELSDYIMNQSIPITEELKPLNVRSSFLGEKLPSIFNEVAHSAKQSCLITENNPDRFDPTSNYYKKCARGVLEQFEKISAEMAIEHEIKNVNNKKLVLDPEWAELRGITPQKFIDYNTAKEEEEILNRIRKMKKKRKRYDKKRLKEEEIKSSEIKSKKKIRRSDKIRKSDKDKIRKSDKDKIRRSIKMDKYRKSIKKIEDL